MIATLRSKLNNLTSDKNFSEVFTGSVWALSARVLATCLAFASSVIISRSYGAEVMGIVAVLNSFLVLATIFTVLGTNTSILRLIPEHLSKHSPTSAFMLYRKIQYLVISVSLVTGTLFFFGSNLVANILFSKPHLSSYFSLAAIFVVFKSLTILNTQAIRGAKQIRVFAFMQIFPHGINLILLILLGFSWSSMDVPVYALLISFALTGIVGRGILGSAFKKMSQPRDLVKTVRTQTILAISLPMLMTATMHFLIGETGIIMLGMFRSESETGYYAIAVRLATLTSFILSAINSMAAPKFSELFHSGKIDELFYVAKKSAKLVFWSTFPILIGFILFGKPLLGTIYGPDFEVAYPALLFLVAGQFVNSISGSTGMFMNMTGNHNVFRNIILVAALTNIVLNFLFIPKIGVQGAAIAAMISVSFWNIATLIYIRSKFGRTTGYLPIFIKTTQHVEL